MDGPASLGAGRPQTEPVTLLLVDAVTNCHLSQTNPHPGTGRLVVVVHCSSSRYRHARRFFATRLNTRNLMVEANPSSHDRTYRHANAFTMQAFVSFMSSLERKREIIPHMRRGAPCRFNDGSDPQRSADNRDELACLAMLRVRCLVR